MIRLGPTLLLGVFVGGTLCLSGQEAGPGPALREAYELLRSHVPGVSAGDLDKAALRGIVQSLSPRVLLVTNTPAAQASSASALVTRATLIDSVAYLRIGQVTAGLAPALRESLEKLSSTQKVSGLALDLRYAGGDDYAAAADVADLFLKKERPLLDWGSGLVKSKAKSDAVTLPVAVLSNRKTAAAAEALAAAVRASGSGLILGSATAGQAMVAKDFPLPGGDKLRVAVGQVSVGNGVTLGTNGVQPDISVEVSPADEDRFYADERLPVLTRSIAPGQAAPGGTNAVRRQPRNEAELVRERREGFTGEVDPSRARRPDAEQPQIGDPVLARAVDLLKGLAVVRPQG